MGLRVRTASPERRVTMIRPEILSDVSSINRSNEMQVLSHYNIRRIVDIYGAEQDRDLGAVGRDVNRIVDDNRKLLPRAAFSESADSWKRWGHPIRACWRGSVSRSSWFTS